MADTSGAGSEDPTSIARLTEILIDDETWAEASPERRREWRVVLDDLLADHHFDADISGPLSVLVTRQLGRILIDVSPARSTNSVALRDEIAIADIEKHLREYLKICADMGQLDEGPGSPKVETLDMAKRLTHDDAARTVQRLFRALSPDHATARRLFTLIVTLEVDTTRLVRPHHLDATREGQALRDRRDGLR